jgi:hypothetical protein
VDFSQPWMAAVSRAVIGGLLLGVSAFLLRWDPDVQATLNNAVKDGLVAGVGFLILRGGFEGGIDQFRAQTGKVLNSDVPVAIAREHGNLGMLRGIARDA